MVKFKNCKYVTAVACETVLARGSRFQDLRSRR